MHSVYGRRIVLVLQSLRSTSAQSGRRHTYQKYQISSKCTKRTTELLQNVCSYNAMQQFKLCEKGSGREPYTQSRVCEAIECKLPIYSRNSERKDVVSRDKMHLLILPTDLSSRALILIPKISTKSTTSSSWKHEPYFENDRILKPLEIGMVSMLKSIKADFSYTCTDAVKEVHCVPHKSSKLGKVTEPADDPKEKIRLLHRKVKQQLPMFFNSGAEWHDFSIYSPIVELHVTPKRYRTVTFSGLQSYKLIARLYRRISKIYLQNSSMDILSTTCFEEKEKIEIRWRVTGTPRHLLPIIFLMPAARKTFVRYYDYMSVIFVNSEGSVWRHDISKMRPAPQSLLSLVNRMRKNVRAAAAIVPFTRKSTPS